MAKKKLNTKIVTAKRELSEKEMSIAGSELADAMEKKDQLVNEAKLKAAEYKDRIANEEAKVKKLRDKLRSGEEDHDFECTAAKDEESKQWIFTDVKTKKVIKRQPFTAADYQLTLDDVENQLIKEGNKVTRLRVVGKDGKKDSKVGAGKSKAKDAAPEPYKFQTGDWVKRPTGKAFQLTLEDMGDNLPKNLKLATAEQIIAAGGTPAAAPLVDNGKESKGYSHNSVLGEKE